MARWSTQANPFCRLAEQQAEVELPSSEKLSPNAPDQAQTEPPEQAPAKPTRPVEIRGKKYPVDRAWFNVSSTVLQAASRQLHLQWDHPLCATRQIIQNHFPASTFTPLDNFSPVVSTEQNFDSLNFPADHPGRQRTNTYYLTEKTLLRTHTSAHQVDVFRQNKNNGYLITADVYRRDEIDRSHYPAFHQVEGALTWDRTMWPDGDVAKAIMKQVPSCPDTQLDFEDNNPPFHAEKNPVQSEHHTEAEVEAIGQHLKRSLEKLINEIVTLARRGRAHARAANNISGRPDTEEDEATAKAMEKMDEVRARWVEAYFPFTSPSWELELFYDGKWHELLGCGIVRQQILIDAGVPSRIGWAFGVGLERIAMLLYDIPDIRYFWSKDSRFLSQFEGVSENLYEPRRFVACSKYPACIKDVSFWLPFINKENAWESPWDDNEVMNVVRSVAGELVEQVELKDKWTSVRGSRSRMFRITYRSLHKTLTNEETNRLHKKVRDALVLHLGVTLR